MRTLIVATAGGTLAAVAAGGVRPTIQTQARVSVGREAFRPPALPAAVVAKVNPRDVVLVEDDDTRYFFDGVLVGLWRSLRGQRIAGLLNDDDPNIVEIEPSWDGTFVEPNESAAAWAERESQKGNFVIAPVFLAYDTSARRYLWTSPTAAPAMGTDAFAVLLAPRSAGYIRTLANDAESGG